MIFTESKGFLFSNNLKQMNTFITKIEIACYEIYFLGIETDVGE